MTESAQERTLLAQFAVSMQMASSSSQRNCTYGRMTLSGKILLASSRLHTCLLWKRTTTAHMHELLSPWAALAIAAKSTRHVLDLLLSY